MVFDRSLKWIFGETARKRSSFSEDYPVELFNDIKTFVDLKEGRKMLEIGCGTGIATLPFARMGLDITALDISEHAIWQACVFTDSFPNVIYAQDSFEERALPEESFDIIVAAQSWHWLDPHRAYEKAHSLLKERGALTLFWKFQDKDNSPLVRAINLLFLKHCDKYPSDFGSTTSTERRLSDCGYFDQPTKIEYRREKIITKDNLATLLQAYSWVRALHTHTRMRAFSDDLFDLLDGEKETISIPYKYVLLMSRKK